ncbi:MAG: hypothetical protein IJU41_08445 [Clostridia bacterium]|nr:hypothetical protein [Clostridia bacterium]
MKTYVKPTIEAVEVSLCDVILTSAPTPDFSISGAKSAGQGNWDSAWEDILRSL